MILEPKKRKPVTTSTSPPSICPVMILFFFLIFSFKLAFSLSSFTFIKRFYRSSSFSAIRVKSSTYLRLLMLLPAPWFQLVTYPAWHFSWYAQHVPLNKQSDSRQCCHTLFSILCESVVPYRVLTVASWSTYRFLKRQVRWSGIPISRRTFHSLLWSAQLKALV